LAAQVFAPGDEPRLSQAPQARAAAPADSQIVDLARQGGEKGGVRTDGQTIPVAGDIMHILASS
jgi:hypothetical protein